MTETRLWKIDGFVADDPWKIVDAETDLDSETNESLVVPLARFLELTESDRRSGRIGVVLAPEDDVSALEPYISDLALIAVTFPAFSDGRAYSQASLARSRYGYAGELRATGDVLIDQVPLMLRCGIDSFAVSNPVAIRRLAEDRLPGIDSYYQPATQPARAAGTYSWRHVS